MTAGAIGGTWPGPDLPADGPRELLYSRLDHRESNIVAMTLARPAP